MIVRHWYPEFRATYENLPRNIMRADMVRCDLHSRIRNAHDIHDTFPFLQTLVLLHTGPYTCTSLEEYMPTSTHGA